MPSPWLVGGTGASLVLIPSIQAVLSSSWIGDWGMDKLADTRLHRDMAGGELSYGTEYPPIFHPVDHPRSARVPSFLHVKQSGSHSDDQQQVYVCRPLSSASNQPARNRRDKKKRQRQRHPPPMVRDFAIAANPFNGDRYPVC